MNPHQHTPAPWMVEPINDGLTYQVTDCNRTDFKVICETSSGDDEDRANAHLIAAAPKLLAAADALLTSAGWKHYARVSPFKELADAVAEAKGEQSIPTNGGAQ